MFKHVQLIQLEFILELLIDDILIVVEVLVEVDDLDHGIIHGIDIVVGLLQEKLG